MPDHEDRHAPETAAAVEIKPVWLLEFLKRRSRMIAFALVLLATARIVATYSVYSHTSDEPAHVASGMEWLDKGTYTYEALHPPLARVAVAIGPYLLGERSHDIRNVSLAMYREGLAILYSGGNYHRTLTAARMGVLPFFWIACWVVFLWARRDFGDATAVIALFIFTFTPSVLAHAGLATTDMALTAFVVASFFTGMVWLEKPTLRNGLMFGAATGLAALSKFSALGFLPYAWLFALVWHVMVNKAKTQPDGVRVRALSLSAAALTGFVIVWAGYRFSIGPVGYAGLILPMPEFFHGLQQLIRLNASTGESYLLGNLSPGGFWAFFPVALAVKVPLALLAAFFAGVALLFRRNTGKPRRWIPFAFSVAILGAAMAIRINIGLRHILPIFAGISILAAIAVVRGLESRRFRRSAGIAIAFLGLWFTASSILSHPDYLPYFNELAMGKPENILIDSDLDWGQDLNRLGKRLKQVNADRVAFTSYVMADLEEQHGFPQVTNSACEKPAPGWNAVSFTVWKRVDCAWPDLLPPGERVGKSIMLWYVKPDEVETLKVDGGFRLSMKR